MTMHSGWCLTGHHARCTVTSREGGHVCTCPCHRGMTVECASCGAVVDIRALTCPVRACQAETL